MKSMRARSIIGVVGALCGCAAMQKGNWSSEPAEGRWHGAVVRGGNRQAVTVDLEKTDSEWVGRFNAGDRTVPLEQVTVRGESIHFATPDDVAFDGRVKGESMVGSLSGTVKGPLELTRESTRGPYWRSGDRQPQEPVLMFGPP